MRPGIILLKRLSCHIVVIFMMTSCSSSGSKNSHSSNPSTDPWTARNPGLLNADGTIHPAPKPHAVTGRSIYVTSPPYSADKTGVSDSRAAIESALRAASYGDEIYFPNGTYLLASAGSSDPKANIRLRSGVNLRGESRSGAILKTTFDDIYSSTNQSGSNNMFVIRGYEVTSLCISNLTITSTFSRRFSADTSNNSRTHGGPDICIFLSGSSSAFSSNIIIENVTVEKYLNIGINAGRGCRDILIKNCTAQSATDVAGGGCGYGFQLAGQNNNTLDNSAVYANPNLGSANDNYFNTIDSCTNGNQYIRHGALIQYWAHNNQVINCIFDGTRLDSVDLHGEDEYNNEIRDNTIRNNSGESAIGLGNSGGTTVIHDKSGPWNYIHDNMISNCKRGISVQYGTPNTIIVKNDISGCTISGGIGINLGFAPGTIVDRNRIHDNSASSFCGIRFYKDNAEGNSRAGSPSKCSVTENTIINNKNGTAVRISAQESGNSFSGNTAAGNADNIIP
jgi:hypothetical protein